MRFKYEYKSSIMECNARQPGIDSGSFAAGDYVTRSTRKGFRRAGAILLLLLAVYGYPISDWVAFAARSEMDSYVILIPFISSMLLLMQCRRLPEARIGSLGGAIGMFLIAITLFILAIEWRSGIDVRDYLALTSGSFVFMVFAGGLMFLGRGWMDAGQFPLAFLFFMVPLPTAVVASLETASQWASAFVAEMFLNIGGVPNLRDGVVFRLPGIAVRVAQECSGIRSSLVLLITSVLASHLLLRNGWLRAVLVSFVIPLGIVRNAFRIFVIGWLCVNIGPQMIDSPIHHRGGPLFFVLSLFPLLILLWGLRRSKCERGKGGGERKLSVGSTLDVADVHG